MKAPELTRCANSVTAGGHATHARDHDEEARKAHTEEHGKK